MTLIYNNKGIMVGDNFSNYDFVELNELGNNDLIMMDVIIYNETSGQIIDSISLSDRNSAELKINKDGWITIAHAVIPSVNFVKSHIIPRNKRIVCSDNKNVFICLNGELYKLENDDLFDLLYKSNNLLFNISFEEFVYIEFLKQKTLELLLKSLTSKEFDQECDLAKNYLDVINHLIKKESNEEAQRLVEQFRNCPGAQKNLLQRKRSSMCGCSK